MIDHPIETPRLLIRRFKLDDWRDLHAYVSDPQVMAYMPDGVMTEAQAQEFATLNAGVKAENYAVILKPNDILIGHIVFHPWYAHRTWEIGWVFNSRYHGQGFASEAAQAVTRYAFEELHIHRLIATCQPENTPSFRIMEKLGMRREAHFRRCIHRGGEIWWDELFYAILEDEWLQDKRRLNDS